MPIIKITAEDSRNPFDSRVMKCHIEAVLDCDGVACGIGNWTLMDGTPVSVDPHFHLVVWGDEPKTAPRYIAFFGTPPQFAEFVPLGPADDPQTF